MRRHYSDKERADGLAVLQSVGGNVSEAARRVGVPVATLRLWSKDDQRAAPIEVQQESKKDLLSLLDSGRFAYAKRLLEPQAIATTSGYYAAMTLKALNEAHQLLSGGPTARIEGNLADFLRSHTGTTDKPAALPNVTRGAGTDKAVTLPN